jgi:hypothetical protein
MRMNISVPDELADQVRALELPISAICQTALRNAVIDTRQDTERITVETGHDYNITEAFTGRWLVHPDPDESRTAEPGYDAGAYWGVALTARGRIAVYVAHCNERFPGQLTDFDTLAEATDTLPADIHAQAAQQLGEDVVILRDI